MKNTIKKFLMMLFLITLLVSCAVLAKPSVPTLSLRTLRLSKKVDGFEYRYCQKKKFLSKKCKVWKIDYYDLSDPLIKTKLINMGFVLKVRVLP